MPGEPDGDAEIVNEADSPAVEGDQEIQNAEANGRADCAVPEPQVESEPDTNFGTDQYLVDLQRVSAEFANFRKQAASRNAEASSRARADLAGRLLPILDACDAAISQGADGVIAIRKAVLDALEPVGLEIVDPHGDPFDPSLHEAVTHEPANDDESLGPEVVEVVRRGYVWAGRVLRPAMVKVRG